MSFSSVMKCSKQIAQSVTIIGGYERTTSTQAALLVKDQV